MEVCVQAQYNQDARALHMRLPHHLESGQWRKENLYGVAECKAKHETGVARANVSNKILNSFSLQLLPT